MKHRLIFVGSLLVAVLLILGTGSSRAQGPGPQGGVSAQAAIGTAFTYQGRLQKNGNPVNDTCDFQFALFDAVSGGNQVGATLTKTGISVSEGLFTVELDFGDQFKGDALYLGVYVKCSGDGGYTPLNPRVSLNPAPYALSLRPGATIQGSSGTILNLSGGSIGVDASGSDYGVYGRSDATYGTGVLGFATHSSGINIGVYGWSQSTSGTGVLGRASASSGTTYGVYGHSLSSSGYGVYGKGAYVGVQGETTGSTGTPYGVYGLASDTGSATSYGVYGESNSTVGTGVGGRAPMNGVFGEATATSGATWGVYGKTNSPNGYGVYSEGNAHVNGLLTWKPITSYISIPAAAFVPQDNFSADTYNVGSIVRTVTGSVDEFNAPVFLPHGSTVVSVTVHWYDDYGAGDGTITLRRTNFSVFSVKMAEVTTSGSGGDGTSTDTTIDFAQVDNSQYIYYQDLRS
ncbi:MAG TPA: hypothetical protein G4O00_15085 [Thermoflexia bacterium]|jgi:hypothetical protein|nr:hypothetical protein [Thermoflexia bacterium]